MCLFEVPFSQGICPAVGLLGYMVVLMNAKELMLLNCGIEEDSYESLGLQGDQDGF